MECMFGEIIEGKVHLSTVGAIVAEEWLKTPHIRTYIELDEWRVMPNHLHGIIIINDHPGVETTRRVVSTKPPPKTLQPNSLGSIIGQIKSSCTKRIWNAGFTSFAWQERFYDHIIRNEPDLHRIRLYIRNNTLQWDLDKNNPGNPLA
jgi:REP element-mobilizing transposase RayT